MKTQTYWRNNNFSFRDKDYSATKGASLWETCPQLALMDPGVGFTFMDDFFRYGVVSEDGWSLTEAGGAGTQAIQDEAGGVLKLTAHSDDDDGQQIQWNSENFKLATGKPLWFESRFKVSDATQSDFLVGLAITDTTLIAANSDGVNFRKADGSTAMGFFTEKNSTETETAAVATIADDTYLKVGFWFDGASTVYGYVNGALVATHITNVCDDEELAISFAVQNGAGAAKSISIDYVKVVQIR